MKELAETQMKIDQRTQYFNIHRSYCRFCGSLWVLQYIILPDDSQCLRWLPTYPFWLGYHQKRSMTHDMLFQHALLPAICSQTSPEGSFLPNFCSDTISSLIPISVEIHHDKRTILVDRDLGIHLGATAL